MHHFKAKGGTTVNFNGDLSGDAHVSVGADRAQYGHALIPCADLIEIVEYWRREYRQTRSGDPENQDDALTYAERAQVELTLSVLSRSAPAYPSLAKLLRIHDRLKASEALAWRTHQSAALQLQAAEARVEELESLIESAKAALVSDANLALGSNRAMLILAPRSPEQAAAAEQLRKGIRGPG